MKPSIIDRGRGPEIAGSRITVYDVLASTRAGRLVEDLAREWRLTVEQIECALTYIDEHRDAVERAWVEIQARNERRRAESEERVKQARASRPPADPELRKRFERVKAEREAQNARRPDRRQPPGTNGKSTDIPGRSPMG
ncbi:MAG: DUF433 domain-containing protein [Zavarzinella sp.]|nr:DUF433 domain-containing protein [Zavarzinella sp.]